MAWPRCAFAHGEQVRLIVKTSIHILARYKQRVSLLCVCEDELLDGSSWSMPSDRLDMCSSRTCCGQWETLFAPLHLEGSLTCPRYLRLIALQLYSVLRGSSLDALHSRETTSSSVLFLLWLWTCCDVLVLAGFAHYDVGILRFRSLLQSAVERGPQVFVEWELESRCWRARNQGQVPTNAGNRENRRTISRRLEQWGASYRIHPLPGQLEVPSPGCREHNCQYCACDMSCRCTCARESRWTAVCGKARVWSAILLVCCSRRLAERREALGWRTPRLQAVASRHSGRCDSSLTALVCTPCGTFMASAQRILSRLLGRAVVLYTTTTITSRVPSGKARTSRTFQTALARFGSLFYSHEL